MGGELLQLNLIKHFTNFSVILGVEIIQPEMRVLNSD
jgi:hypothetical protein